MSISSDSQFKQNILEITKHLKDLSFASTQIQANIFQLNNTMQSIAQMLKVYVQHQMKQQK